MSKTITLELPDDLAALLDTPQKQAEALAYLRERLGRANGHGTAAYWARETLRTMWEFDTSGETRYRVREYIDRVEAWKSGAGDNPMPEAMAWLEMILSTAGGVPHVVETRPYDYSLAWEGEELDDEADEKYAPLTPADLEAIGRGLADSDAGRVIDGDTFLRELNTPITELRTRA